MYVKQTLRGSGRLSIVRQSLKFRRHASVTVERILQTQNQRVTCFNEYFYSVFNNDTSSPPLQAPENGDLSVPLFTVGQVLSVLKIFKCEQSSWT